MPGDELLAELDLGMTPRKKPKLQSRVIRALEPGDLPALVAPPSLQPEQAATTRIRHSHHQAAQLLAAGAEEIEVSRITGYSPAWLSKLKNDPAFQELLAVYASERHALFIDVVERMRQLGLSTLDELQERLEEDPGNWSRRELMELAQMCLLKGAGMPAGPGGGGAGPAVSVNVKFVTASAGPQIDPEATDVTWSDDK